MVGWTAVVGKYARAARTQASGAAAAPKSFTYAWGRKTKPAELQAFQSRSWRSGLQYEETPAGRGGAGGRGRRPQRAGGGASAWSLNPAGGLKPLVLRPVRAAVGVLRLGIRNVEVEPVPPDEGVC